jgi:hypothetical protein
VTGPPLVETFITEPSTKALAYVPGFVQYRLPPYAALKLAPVCPEASVTRHRPEVHAAVEGEIGAWHNVPQPPQLLLSVCWLTHVLVHQDSPDSQPHAPFWQIWLPAQGLHATPPMPQIADVSAET